MNHLPEIAARRLCPVHGWLREFRTFLKRGNIVDLAVGVMIGGAFGKIVSSLVADILTPPIGLLIDEVNFSALKIHLGGPSSAPVAINYGNFLQALLDFTIMATVLFVVVRLMQRVRGTSDQAGLTKEQQLLTEIRDELRGSCTGANQPAVTAGSNS